MLGWKKQSTKMFGLGEEGGRKRKVPLGVPASFSLTWSRVQLLK